MNFCVPMDTTALTPGGWKHHDELQVGDEVLGYDIEASVMRWTKVTNKYLFHDAPVIELANSRWKARTTPQHRWSGSKHVDRGGAGHQWDPRFLTTAEMGIRHRITLSAPAETPARLDLTEQEISIIGWLHTDGHMQRTDPSKTGPSSSHGRRRHFRGSIFQKKLVYVEKLDEILIGVPHSRYTRPTGTVEWRLQPQYLRDLWQYARLDELTLEEFVLCLDPRQRQAFVDAFMDAEGWVDQNGTIGAGQNEGPMLEAMRLAMFLQGSTVSCSDSIGYNGNNNVTLRPTKPFVTGQRITKTELDPQDAWCVETELGTWVMRQGTHMMITGDSQLHARPTTSR